MAIKLGATGITFHDNSVQTTAGGPVTTQYAIGSYILGRPANITSYNNSTIAGSSLYATPAQTVYMSGYNESPYDARWSTIVSSNLPFTGEMLINTGSWRCVSIALGGRPYSSGPNYDDKVLAGLWVRYA